MEIMDTPVGDVTRNCKNYLSDGGDRLVIGGTRSSGYRHCHRSAIGIRFRANGWQCLPNDKSNRKRRNDHRRPEGDFNALLLKLKNAGIMAADQPSSVKC